MPDVAVPRRSSISGPPRSSKKSGAPKAKGAVRAKSGCYTCRIRRKKCDERQDHNGSCETCVRLRLQCLGFGAKRPDYLKDGRNVSDFRDKIKSFLASNGMIKGHSNTGPRPAEEEPAVLRLVEESYASSISSPQTDGMSSPDSDDHRTGLTTSYVREPQYTLSMPESHYSSHLEMNPHLHQLSPDSPPLAPRRLDILSPLTMPPSMSSNSLAPVSTSWPVSSAECYRSLAVQSSFGSLYHEYPYGVDDAYDNVEQLSPENGIHQAPLPPPPHMLMTPFISDSPQYRDLIYHYLQNVVHEQYLLADESVNQMILDMIKSTPSTLHAACVLSSLHKQRRSPHGHDSELNSSYENVRVALFNPGRLHSEEDIMAGLIMVSSYLFLGGRGSWKDFLDIARTWVQATLSDPRYHGPRHVLQHCRKSTRFVIKTTMWFDVLASITELTPPHLLPIFRELFGRSSSYIGDDPGISMLKPMGCDNEIVLALAEISNLAWWKDNEQKRNRLSVVELTAKGRDIEERYLISPSHTAAVITDHSTDERHKLASDIFRASARVYLHSVISGDYPLCPEISTAVADTINCLKRVPCDEKLGRSIVRSVVFSICICGCLTDDPQQRAYLMERLGEQEKYSQIGNCPTVQTVMRTVWEKRDNLSRQQQFDRDVKWRRPYPPVNWREVMQENNQGLLLLV